MNSATISTKGRLVIPARFRKALQLQAGDNVSLTLAGDKLLLQREQSGRARLVLVAPPGAPPMTPERINALRDETP